MVTNIYYYMYIIYKTNYIPSLNHQDFVNHLMKNLVVGCE